MQLLELEAAAADETCRCSRLAKGVKAYTLALDAFADAQATLADVCCSYADDKDRDNGGLICPPTFAVSLRQRVSTLRSSKMKVEALVTERLVPLAEGAFLKDYLEKKGAFAAATSTFDSCRRDGRGGDDTRTRARLALERQRLAMLSSALGADAGCRLAGAAVLCDLAALDVDMVQSLAEVSSQVSEALTASAHERARQQRQLMAQQDELSGAFAAFCAVLSAPENAAPAQHHAGVGPDSSGRMAKLVHSAMLLTSEPGVEAVPIKSGYLRKRYPGALVDSWKRRFFVADSFGLLYYLSNSDRPLPIPSSGHGTLGLTRRASASESATTPAVKGKGSLSLLTCTVRAGQLQDLPSAFTVTGLSGAFELQAESDAERDSWIEALQVCTAELINRRCGGGGQKGLMRGESGPLDYSTAEGAGRVLETLWRLPGNSSCAECGAASPDWAVMNHGVLICMGCSGAHRRLGAHISKVRSCTLDTAAWSRPALALFEEVGNSASKAVLEAGLPSGDTRRPRPDDSAEAKAAFISAKYVMQSWFAQPDLDTPPAEQLTAAVGSDDRGAVLRVLLAGPAVRPRAPDEAHPEGAWVAAGSISLFRAIASGRIGLLELLLHHLPPACLATADGKGRTPLHAAALHGDVDALTCLLRRGADPCGRDCEGALPSHLAGRSAAPPGCTAAVSLLLAAEALAADERAAADR